MPTIPQKPMTDAINKGLSAAHHSGTTPDRIYIGFNQYTQLRAEVEYYAGFNIRQAVDGIQELFMGLELIRVAKDDHLCVVGTGVHHE